MQKNGKKDAQQGSPVANRGGLGFDPIQLI